MLKIIKNSLPIIFLFISLIVLLNIAIKILDKKTIDEKIIEEKVVIKKNCICVDKFNKLYKNISNLENELLNLKKENKSNITIEEITKEETGTTIKWPPSFKINFTAPSELKK